MLALCDMQGLASIMTNPILQDGLSGLACTATAFAAIEVRSRLFFLSGVNPAAFGGVVRIASAISMSLGAWLSVLDVHVPVLWVLGVSCLAVIGETMLQSIMILTLSWCFAEVHPV